jgi:hypothetical protein
MQNYNPEINYLICTCDKIDIARLFQELSMYVEYERICIH